MKTELCFKLDLYVSQFEKKVLHLIVTVKLLKKKQLMFLTEWHECYNCMPKHIKTHHLWYEFYFQHIQVV